MEATKNKKQSIIDKAFGGTFMNSVMCLNCKKVSRTVQRFTEVIVEMNFKAHNGQKRKNSYNYNYGNNYKNSKMSKRERKKNKNKKNRKNQKNKYFNSTFESSIDYSQTTVPSDPSPELLKTMIEYQLSEDQLEEENNSLDPKTFFLVDPLTTIIDEERESEEREDEGEGSDVNSEGEDRLIYEVFDEVQQTGNDQDGPDEEDEEKDSKNGSNSGDWEIVNKSDAEDKDANEIKDDKQPDTTSAEEMINQAFTQQDTTETTDKKEEDKDEDSEEVIVEDYKKSNGNSKFFKIDLDSE
jgi:hypothetical protein